MTESGERKEIADSNTVFSRVPEYNLKDVTGNVETMRTRLYFAVNASNKL